MTQLFLYFYYCVTPKSNKRVTERTRMKDHGALSIRIKKSIKEIKYYVKTKDERDTKMR